MADNKAPQPFINPFSEGFLLKWSLWKEFKKKEFKFSFKSEISENAAIAKLHRLSQGKEDLAFKIIMQSIENGWQGHFNYKNDGNGKSYFNGSQSATAGGQDPTRIATDGIGQL